MTDIRTQWSEVARRLRTADSLMFLADFDGTLVDQDGDTGAPSLNTLGKSVLQSLTRLSGLTLAIHGTGALRNLATRAGVENIWYVANGGLDIRDPEGGETRFYGPDDVRIMTALHNQLVSQIRQLKGVGIDLGGPTLTLRYRRVDPTVVPAVLETFRTAAQSAGPMVMTLHSPGVIEARIRSACDERSAVRYIRRQLKPGVLIFYFGHNARVQDALRDLHPPSIVVESGMRTLNQSEYSIPDPPAVLEVLTRLAGEWSNSRSGGTIPGGPAGFNS
jgi:trehalose-phosphatase